MACMDQNDIDVEQGERPFRNTTALEQLHSQQSACNHLDKRTVKLTFLSMACMHCEDAPCVKACPTGCLHKDIETGLTLLHSDQCIGCHSCATVCPFGAPTFGVDGTMRKCDGCVERIRARLVPACVRVCPSGALTVQIGPQAQTVQVQKSLQALAKTVLK